ncbi:hypothetical protein [Candidatus Palauibacter sp.]|uniref:hypothetical protein n=1 Tax=Candidatus Palauibacter sp. TaxID=3101350 RepID=UPI003B01E691
MNSFGVAINLSAFWKAGPTAERQRRDGLSDRGRSAGVNRQVQPGFAGAAMVSILAQLPQLIRIETSKRGARFAVPQREQRTVIGASPGPRNPDRAVRPRGIGK